MKRIVETAIEWVEDNFNVVFWPLYWTLFFVLLAFYLFGE